MKINLNYFYYKKNMTVEKIMTKNVKSVKINTSLVNVSKLLSKKRLHAVPVVDDNKKVLGIITENDFFTKDLSDTYLPTYINFLKKAKFKSKISKKEYENVKKLLEAKAGDIMAANCLTTSPKTSIKKLLEIFQTKKYYSIPVVDKTKKLIGIVTQQDILKIIK